MLSVHRARGDAGGGWLGGPRLVSAPGPAQASSSWPRPALVYLLDFRLGHDWQPGKAVIICYNTNTSRDLMDSIRH